MFDPFTYQVELERLIEDLKHETITFANAIKHFTRIGRYLLIGQEFLTPDEFQAALRYCDLTEGDVAFSIEVCRTAASMDRDRQCFRDNDLI